MTEQDALAGVVRRIDTGQVAEGMVATFRAGISGYQRLPEEVVLGQIADITLRNIEIFFTSVIDGRPPSEEELVAFRESAKARATEGMPLEDLLHAYRLGGRLGWQAIVDEATSEEQEALKFGADLLMAYVDRVTAAVTEAYLEERQHPVSEEERSLRELLDSMMDTGPLDFRLQELAERFSFPVSDRYRPFAEAVPGAAARDHSRMAAALRARGVLTLTEGNRVSGLLGPDRDEVPTVAEGAVLAVGEPTGRAELAESMEEVRLLVDFGCRLGRVGLISRTELLPELLLARSPRLAALLERQALGPLEEYAERRSSDLVETLMAFLALDLDRRAAAEHLHVHRNTLDYRLRRIAELTGFDLGKVDDLVLLALAARARAVAARPPAPIEAGADDSAPGTSPEP
jgi:hypothetical protein